MSFDLSRIADGDYSGALDAAPSATKPAIGDIERIIRDRANAYGVDPDKMVSLAKRESSLNPSAQNSGSTAGGLFQFIDGTWNQYGNGANKYDPVANADAAARMMRDNLNRFGGDYKLALAAHHVGPGKARKAMTDASIGDADVSTQTWLDDILSRGGKSGRQSNEELARSIAQRRQAERDAGFSQVTADRNDGLIGGYNPLADSSDSDFMRGLRQYWPQTKQMGNDAMIIAGKAMGDDSDIGKWLIDSGLEGHNAAQAQMDSIGEKESDSFTKAMAMGPSALVDWAQHGFGQAAGNLLESLATMAIGVGAGAVAGSSVGGAGAAPGAVIGATSGLLYRTMMKQGVKEAAEKILAAKGEQAAADFVIGQAKDVLKNRGMNMALAAGAGFHGVGEVGGRAIDESLRSGQGLDGVDLSKVLPAAAGHAGLEFVGDKVLAHGILGEGGYRAAGKGAIPYAKTLAGNMATTGIKEAPVEAAQTVAERYGAGLPLANGEAAGDYTDAATQALLFGPAGIPSGHRAYNAPVKPEDIKNSPLTRAAAASAPHIAAQEAVANEQARANDPLAEQVGAIGERLNDRDFYNAVRQHDNLGPQALSDILASYRVASNYNLDIKQREAAIERLNTFFQQFDNQPNFTIGANGEPSNGGALVPAGQQGVVAGKRRETSQPGVPTYDVGAAPQLGFGNKLLTEQEQQVVSAAEAEYEAAYQDLVKAEQLGAGDAELMQKQIAARNAEARLQEIHQAIDGNRQQETAAKRDALLNHVLDVIPPDQNPNRAFDRALKAAGFTDTVFSEAERAKIAQWQQLSDSFHAEHEQAASTPNQMDAAALGIKAKSEPQAQGQAGAKLREVDAMLNAGMVRRGDRMEDPRTGRAVKLSPAQIARAKHLEKTSERDRVLPAYEQAISQRTAELQRLIHDPNHDEGHAVRLSRAITGLKGIVSALKKGASLDEAIASTLGNVPAEVKGALNNPRRDDAEPAAEVANTDPARPNRGGGSVLPPAELERAQKYAAELRSMAPYAGWAEIGGRLIRDNNDNATSRTKWIPRAEWFVAGMLNSPKASEEAVRKAIAGDPMLKPERLHVMGMMDWLDAQHMSESAGDTLAAYDAAISEDSDFGLPDYSAEAAAVIELEFAKGSVDVPAFLEAIGANDEENHVTQDEAGHGQAGRATGEGAQAGRQDGQDQAGAGRTGPQSEGFSLSGQTNEEAAADHARQQAGEKETPEQERERIKKESEIGAGSFSLAQEQKPESLRQQEVLRSNGMLFGANGQPTEAAKQEEPKDSKPAAFDEKSREAERQALYAKIRAEAQADPRRTEELSKVLPAFDAETERLRKASSGKRSGESDLHNRGNIVADYVQSVIKKTPHESSIHVGVISDVAAQRISGITGVHVDSAVEVVIADSVVHAMNRHPDLTLDDWRQLPIVTDLFDDAEAGKPNRSNDSLKRIVLRKQIDSDGSGYGAVYDFAPGGRRGNKRLNLVSFFRGTKASLDAWWENNKGFESTVVPNSTEPASSAHDVQTKPLDGNLASATTENKLSDVTLANEGDIAQGYDNKGDKLLSSKPFSEAIEKTASGWRIKGDPDALADQARNIFGKGVVKRKDGITIATKTDDVSGNFPVRYDEYEVAGVPNRYKRVQVRVQQDGKAWIVGQEGGYIGPVADSVEAALDEHRKMFGDPVADVSKKEEKTNTSPKPVQETAKSEQVDPSEPAPQASQNSEEFDSAKAMFAEGIDELISLLGGKVNLTPEEETRIIPIISKILRGAAGMGFAKFKDAARNLLDVLRAKAPDIAGRVELKNLQAAYINIHGMDVMQEVAAIKSIDDLYAVDADTQERIEAAEDRTNHDATPGQKDAGNYRKGKFPWNGLTVSVETAKGEDRTDKETNGKKWRVTMPATYGYILGTKGADGDHVDVFMGDKPDSGAVYVINQTQPDVATFDEHKVMLGYSNEADAKADYLASFSNGFGKKVFGSLEGPFSIDEFKQMLADGDLEAKNELDYGRRLDDSKPLSDITVTVEATEAETGRAVEMDEQADEALKDVDDRMNLARRLLECLAS